MLTIAFGRAVRLALLYLSTGCCCLYIPNVERESFGNGFRDDKGRRIQICGSELTSMIMFVCDGYVTSYREVHGENSTPNENKTFIFDHDGIVEKCCNNPCDREFLLQHCAEKPKWKTLLQSKGELPAATDWANHINGSGTFGTEEPSPKTTATGLRENRKNNLPKVRLRKGKKSRKNRKYGKLGCRKRKSLFKSDCIYLSFGNFLLNLDRGDRYRNKIRKRKNVQSFEIGTIKPEIYGGDPVVVRPRMAQRKS